MVKSGEKWSGEGKVVKEKWGKVAKIGEKWGKVAILDVRNSLSIVFLAISDRLAISDPYGS